MYGSAPNRSRVGSHVDVETKCFRPAWAMAGEPVRHSSATIRPATTSTPNPSAVSTTAQARSGTFARDGADSGIRSVTARLSLAGCKDRLPLHRDRLQGLLDLLHQRVRERRVVEAGGHLLAV